MHADRRAETAEDTGRRVRWRFLPLAVIGAAAAVLLAGGAHQVFSIETLRAHHVQLGAWVGAHWPAAAAGSSARGSPARRQES